MPLSFARYSFITVVCLALTACNSSQPPRGYFPLQQGLSWQYKVVNVTPTKRTQNYLFITNIGTQTIDKETYHVRKTNTGNFYYLQQRDDGIVRLARRTVADRNPIFDETPRFVIKNPPEVGTKWKYLNKPYLINRPQQNNNEMLRRSIDYEMTWEIAGTDKVVEIAAGRFEHCLYVRGTGTVSMARPLSISRDEIVFTTSEWYAPGVGLLRLEHKEEVDSNQTNGGSIIMELIEFKS